MVFHTAHLGIEKIADGFGFLEPLESEFRGVIAARGLDEDFREAEPAFDEVGTEVDVRNPRVINDNLTAKKNTLAHRDARIGELVAHRMVAKPIVGRDYKDERRDHQA
jgi:hypothetical protein